MNARMALLAIRGLTVRFQRERVVSALDLQILAGETLALVGESGCGKSTTALSILRLLSPSARVEGEIWLDGKDLLRLPQSDMERIRGRDISMIFQEPMSSLNPLYTVGYQIAETLRRHQGLSAKAAHARATELLDLVRIPEPQRRVHDFPHQLSGGQRQRVMIAMAVACRPRLLIADEPTTALDVTIQAQILELLDALRREFSMSLLLISHDLGLVSQWAHRVAVMYAGEKVEEAPTDSLFASPAHAYTQGLLGASLHGGRNLHYSQTCLPEIRVSGVDAASHRFVLHTPALHPKAPVDAVATPLLDVQGLHTQYATSTGSVHAVRDVSFSIYRGQTLGLVGESGCGKSTLSKTLLRLVDASAGKVLLDGTDLLRMQGQALQPWRRKIQMVFQDPFGSLNPRRTVREILDSVLKVHGFAAAQDRRTRIATILDRVGLVAASAQRYPHEFSGGQRQRIGIARALVVEPELVVLDEPVSALNVSVQAQILNLLVELKQDLHLSYLFISHDLSVVRYIADRVMVMHQGRIVESGTHQSIWSAPQHPYTRSLIDAVPRARATDPASAEIAYG